MIRHTAVCDHCGREAPAVKLGMGWERPSGWFMARVKRKMLMVCCLDCKSDAEGFGGRCTCGVVA